MSKFLNSWLLGRMSAPREEDNVIYRLSDYTCDGTAATAINTGLYLFDATVFPNGWEIDFDFEKISDTSVLASYLRCRNSTSPYNGISIRRANSNINNMQCQISSASKDAYGFGNGRRHLVHITTSDLSNCTISIDGSEFLTGSVSSVISPLVIGGELQSDISQIWNSSRFSNIYIHSLIVTKL